MSSLIIVRPLTPSALTEGSAYAGGTVSRLLTPDPKEAAIATAVPNGSSLELRLDMGAVVSLDTFLLGYSNLVGANVTMNVYPASSSYAVGALAASVAPCASVLVSPQPHMLATFAPTASRYWVVRVTNATGGAITFALGVLAVGLSFAANWGKDMGAGRGIEDMSNIDRTFGGGFEIDAGAIVGGYSWTLGNLSKTEIAQLYAIARACGNSRPILVVENLNDTPIDNESIHWGIFDKLDFYERNSPDNWKWALKVRDWG